MMAAAVIIVMLLLIQDLLLYTFLVLNFQDHYQEVPHSDLPSVTVLLPARNEALNIQTSLQALEKVDYPQEKLQIILGDDGSSDATPEIMRKWAEGRTNVQVKSINTEGNIHMNGKANALSQMIQKASGELFLFTDADCKVGSRWIKELVGAAYGTKADLVTGITMVEPKNWFCAIQGMDWWLTLGMVKVMSDRKVGLTSMGNNMLLSRRAYEEFGGFEALPFSMTEDFEIALAVGRLGRTTVHEVSPEALIVTQGATDFSQLLAQRKRWMRGAMGLSLFWKLLLLLQVLFFPAVLLLLLFGGWWAILLWAVKIWFQGALISYFAGKTETRIPYFHLISFEFYYLFISWSTIVYYFWPAKIKWKGRSYP
jgi:cellulose synthase/poly-beta-1,6-N-acetylglucosamine synthase-like glycosyltransferase